MSHITSQQYPKPRARLHFVLISTSKQLHNNFPIYLPNRKKKKKEKEKKGKKKKKKKEKEKKEKKKGW